MSIGKYVLSVSTGLVASAFICGVGAKRAEAFGLYQQNPNGSYTFINLSPDPLQTTQVDECELFGGRSCHEAELPSYLKELIIQAITQESGVAPIGLQVTRSQHVTWSNGCGESYQPGMICNMMMVPDWRVTVEDSMFRRNYSIGYSSVFLMSQERINQTTSPRPGTATEPVPEPGTVLGSLSALAIAIGMRKFSRRKTNTDTVG